MKVKHLLSIGFAIFCMFFGAGNVAMPMILGKMIGDQVWYGILGFTVVGVIIPLLGLVSVMLCDGDYKKLLGRLGEVPGAVAAFICIMMMGPFMGIARCIIIAHASIHLYLPSCSLFIFSIIASLLVYALAIKQSNIVTILGTFLGPIKLVLLLAVITIGMLYPAPFLPSDFSAFEAIYRGGMQGMQTGDLLGSIFFSTLIVIGIKNALGNSYDSRKLAIAGLKTGTLGALALGTVYAGFCLVAAYYGQAIASVERVNIFSTLANLVLGSLGGLFANVTVAIACLTTAIALVSIFASYLSQDLFKGSISYHPALIITIICTIIASNLGFNKITDCVAEPVFLLIYPSLIVLSLVNIAHELWGFNWIKTSVFASLIINIIIQYGTIICSNFSLICGN